MKDLEKVIEEAKNLDSTQKNRLLKDAFRTKNRIFQDFSIALNAGRDSVDNELFFLAVENGCVEIVQSQIDAGIDVRIKDNEAIFKASSYNQLEVLKLLIKHGADVNATSNYGECPLYKACDMGYVEIAKYLLDAGADVSVHTKALYRATFYKHSDIVKLLLDNGATATTETIDFAILKNNSQIVKLLFEAGADPTVNFYTNLAQARKNNNRLIENLLLSSSEKN